MGKRELVIALAFIALGVVAYQMTAPPSQPNERGFSLTRFWEKARREMRGNAAAATTTTTGTLLPSAELAELRIEGIGPGRIRVVGESRRDIAYDLIVESTGPDPDTAMAFAKRVTLATDDLGSALTLRVSYPREYRQSATLQVHLPSSLAVLVAGADGSAISGVKSVHLDGVGGDWTIRDVAGPLTGTHRNGSLAVAGAGSVKLTMQRSRATIERITGAVTLDVREGECHLADARGPVEIEELRAELSIVNAGGAVRVTGSDGRVTLVHPAAESKLDLRRAGIDVQLDRAVPLTLLTTNDTLRLVLTGPPAISVDAVANQGQIDAKDFGLQAEVTEAEQRVTHAFGDDSGARVSLRNSRGDIVIKNSRGTIVDPDRK